MTATAPTPRAIAPEEVPHRPDRRIAVRVWDLPVRVTHWVIFAAVAVLSFTGFYIGTPYFSVAGEGGSMMRTMRFVHIVSGWVFTAAIIARVVWGFIGGNRWARWDQFIPVTRHRWNLAVDTLRYYLFLRRQPPPVVGHNPLAGMAYSLVYGMFYVQILTGLALASLPDRSGPVWVLTGWVFSIIPIPVARLIHHLIMWMTLGFIVHHIYSVVLIDSEERSGLFSSIVTGDKDLPEDRVE
jgi:Ni/Fe-hydrogenase 1 B-type cytochrome subunit